MPTPKKVRWADSFGRSHEKSPSMPRPALSFATVQCPFWREFWPPPNRLLFGDDGAMLPTLKCQDGAVFSFFLFESYSNFKRLNCLDCVRAGIHDEFKMQQSMRRHSAASWLGCNRPFARDAEMCHRSASVPGMFIDGLGGHVVLEHHDHRTLVGHVQLVDGSVVGWHVCSSTYERRYCLFQSTKR